MKIIRPLPTLCEHILSYNVTQTVPLWNVATSYAKDVQVVIEGCGAVVYQSLTSSNIGNPPATSPANWAAVGVSNYFAMFDEKVGTQTTNANTISIEIEVTGLVNSVAIINAVGKTARFEAWDANDVKIMDTTISLYDYGVADWYEYFFKEPEYKDRFVSFSVPTFGAGRGKLTLDNTGSIAKLGALIYGNQYTIGQTQSGLAVGIKDYSIKETDGFGNYIIVERAFSDKIGADVVIETNKVQVVKKTLTTYRSRPLIWVGDADVEPSITYGYYRDFNINLTNHGLSDCTIQIEGLV